MQHFEKLNIIFKFIKKLYFSLILEIWMKYLMIWKARDGKYQFYLNKK